MPDNTQSEANPRPSRASNDRSPRHADVELPWRRSSFCQGSDSTCVEVAISPSSVAVRDSKEPHGPLLHFTEPEWRAFLLAVHAGEFDLPKKSSPAPGERWRADFAAAHLPEYCATSDGPPRNS
jgi:hypothetical protein